MLGKISWIVLTWFLTMMLSDIFSQCVQCSVAINQLTKGRNKEEESSELQSLAAEALLKDYKHRAPEKLPLLSTMLKNMKLIS